MIEARRRIETSDGHRIAYVERGGGPSVILIHGVLTSLEDMAIGLFDALADRNRVVSFDRPGHGESDRLGFLDASPWRQAELIHEAAAKLGLERPVIVGHSFGGAVALAYATAYPQDTLGVVALAPMVFPEPRLEHLVFGPRALPGLGEMIALATGAGLDPVLLPVLWRAMFLPQQMPARFQEGFPFELAGRRHETIATGEDSAASVTALWKSVAEYPFCRVPVRIFGGDRDLVLNNMLHGQALAWIMPNATFNTVRGVGHMLQHFISRDIATAVADLQV